MGPVSGTCLGISNLYRMCKVAVSAGWVSFHNFGQPAAVEESDEHVKQKMESNSIFLPKSPPKEKCKFRKAGAAVDRYKQLRLTVLNERKKMCPAGPRISERSSSIASSS